MFCAKCGAELPNDAKFCKGCGERTHINQEEKAASVLNGIKPNMKWIIIAAAAVLVVVFLLIFGGNGVNSSPESVAIATIKSEYEADTDTMVEVFPEFLVKQIAVENGLTKNASRGDLADALEEAYRRKTPKQVEILSTERVGEYTTDRYIIFRELYDYMTDEDYDDITKVVKVKVKFTVNGDTDSITLPCIEMNGDWYYLRKF